MNNDTGINNSLISQVRGHERKFIMEKMENYHMICDLLEQIKFACVGLEDLRTIAETPEEIQKIDAVLEGNKRVIAKAEEELKTIGV